MIFKVILIGLLCFLSIYNALCCQYRFLKKIPYWIIISIFVMIIVNSIYINNKTEYNQDFNLENKIVENIEADATVDLNKLVNFNFEKVYVCKNSIRMIDILKDKSFAISHKKIDGDSNYLIFVNKNNKVVRFTGLNKKYKILNSTFKIYSKKDAIFKFDKLRCKDTTVYELK
ncbi:hypothetical protein C4194_00015 [Clostridioides difficile]|nr:hypothetical protein [Clostridioides difficile]MDB3409133.1 hypothetical protein [Clostridioides difficile]MDB3466634.1 hypothetical protein [Clostridioides difficile]MDB3586425.1 hypothetical protein [Clostridioides difficile]MDB3593659.1 hypothetical protein [Clostridioides difficile]